MAPDSVAWAAGLFEGEGCISIHTEQRSSRNPNKTARLTLAMRDEDVVRRFQRAVGGRGTVFVRRNKNTKWQPLFVWEAAASDSMDVLMMLIDYLGERRTKRAWEVFDLLFARYRARECKRCGQSFQPTRQRGGRPQVYCSESCGSKRSAINRQLRAGRGVIVHDG